VAVTVVDAADPELGRQAYLANYMPRPWFVIPQKAYNQLHRTTATGYSLT
jgi:hypothetical protein